MKRLFTQFSLPGGIPSHVAPATPGSIHEGGELGSALSPHLAGPATVGCSPGLLRAAWICAWPDDADQPAATWLFM